MSATESGGSVRSDDGEMAGLNGVQSGEGVGNPSHRNPASPGHDREDGEWYEFLDFVLGISAFEDSYDMFLPEDYDLSEAGGISQYNDWERDDFEDHCLDVALLERGFGILFESEDFNEYWEDSAILNLYGDCEYEDVLGERNLFESKPDDCLSLIQLEEDVLEQVWNKDCSFDGSFYQLMWDCGVGQDEAEPSSGESFLDQSLGEGRRCRMLGKLGYCVQRRRRKLEALWRLARMGLDSGAVRRLLVLWWLELRPLRECERPRPPPKPPYLQYLKGSFPSSAQE